MDTVSNRDAPAGAPASRCDDAGTGTIDQSSGLVQNANRIVSMSRKIR